MLVENIWEYSHVSVYQFEILRCSEFCRVSLGRVSHMKIYYNTCSSSSSFAPTCLGVHDIRKLSFSDLLLLLPHSRLESQQVLLWRLDTATGIMCTYESVAVLAGCLWIFYEVNFEILPCKGSNGGALVTLCHLHHPHIELPSYTDIMYCVRRMRKWALLES